MIGTQPIIDKPNSNIILKDEHSSKTLNELLIKLIESFISCQQCSIPETLFILKKSILKIRCSACGHIVENNKTHKITKFIINNKHVIENKKKC
jgi:translation initiation factor 2 beta subunit (eIF-2beta)/eIF-5